jgi:hypothetical protein
MNRDVTTLVVVTPARHQLGPLGRRAGPRRVWARTGWGTDRVF